jgi:LEA14-like dessication related protein
MGFRQLAFRVAALTVALAPGCAGLRDLAGMQRPTLAFESASIEGLDLDGVTVVLHYRLTNPNALGLHLARLAYGLEVEGQRVAAGELPAGLQIPGRGTVPFPVPVRFRFQDLPGLLGTLLSKEEVSYRVSGVAGLDSPIGALDLPFEHSGKAPVPRPPAFAIESARLDGTLLRLRLRIANRNAFPLPAGGLDYRVELAGATVARGTAAQVAPVPPGGSAALDLPVSLDLALAGRALSQALGGGSPEVALRGSAGFGALKVPLDLKGRVSGR